GRRITKHAQAVYFEPLGAGSVYIHNERARVNKELGCGLTLYGWDGDTLAWEARRDADIMRQGAYHPSPGSTRTTHYLYEPNSFVPIAQGVTHGTLPLHKQPAYAEADYDIDEDPLWQYEIQPTPFDSLAWYQCDHLGTPQELTDQTGEIAWSANYKAWGAAQEVISDAARKAGIQNPIRFQGQYFDHETGLHYNRHRYYDPSSGRFISKDPIGLAGGINGYQYAPNPMGWVDPLGLSGFEPKVLTSGTVFRNASGTPDSLTPRLGKDTTRIDGKEPGLSAATSEAGLDSGKYVELDVGKLCSCGLQATHDKPNGHVTIRPINDPTDSKLTDWAKSRGGGSTHSLTEGILGAVTGRGKK
ncbi:RHS repeat-associated core domain-containing protein, partial [Ralstonia sp. 22111]|uniref:RHS repeat-associated core domain-containing protein n=1 Tax=Ralstonia sp. 22111 TaxID=3453878 RepID=UPI003F850C63